MAKHNWLTTLLPGYGMYTLLDNIVGKGGPLKNLVTSVFGKYLGTNLTGQDREANDFNERMQEDAQQHDYDFANYQDQLARQYYQDVQSPQAQVQQYQNAGLNPALMYGRGATTPASPATFGSSGSSGTHSVNPDSGDIGQLISLIAGVKFKGMEALANKQLKGAQQSYYDELATNLKNQNSIFQEKWQLYQKVQNSTIANIDADTVLKYSTSALRHAEISEKEANTAFLNAQTLIANSDAKYRDQLNDALLKVRISESNLNVQQTYESESREDLNDQQWYLNEQTWDEQKGVIRETLRKMSAEAGISEKEFDAFWTEKRLEAFAIQAKAYSDLKNNIKLGPFQVSGTNPFFYGAMGASSFIPYGFGQ